MTTENTEEKPFVRQIDTTKQTKTAVEYLVFSRNEDNSGKKHFGVTISGKLTNPEFTRQGQPPAPEFLPGATGFSFVNSEYFYTDEEEAVVRPEFFAAVAKKLLEGIEI